VLGSFLLVKEELALRCLAALVLVEELLALRRRGLGVWQWRASKKLSVTGSFPQLTTSPHGPCLIGGSRWKHAHQSL
jgi:hypothetical protein